MFDLKIIFLSVQCIFTICFLQYLTYQLKKTAVQKMRFDLFSKGDSVLLLGEGNFSFAVSLHKQHLPIKIVATGFNSDCEFEGQLQNIEYLKSNKVPVFLNVDATKLLENANFFGAKFSKIIFNFPHIGGKMKIHLNRLLLQKVFENCRKIIEKNGLMMISLCRGQGGTPADKPQRRWDDSWQITELAAYGDFILTRIEPFLNENFPDYQCVGYRGQSVKFHLKGALVHIFAKRDPPYPCLNENVVAKRMNLVPLRKNSGVLVPIIYADLYEKNPMKNMASHISYFKSLLVNNLSEVSINSKWKYLSDDQVPVYVESGAGVSCQVNFVKRVLRSSPFDILPNILKQLSDDSLKNNIMLFPGMYFRTLKRNFLENAPIQFEFVICAENLLIKIEKFLNNLIDLFKNKNVMLLQRSKSDAFNKIKLFPINSCTELVYESCENETYIVAARLFSLQYKETEFEIGFINAQIICQYFFEIGWREIWAESTEVLIEDKPTFRQILLYPFSYKFDITLKSNEFYSEEEFCRILWLAAGQLIEGVETINEYISVEGWSSKCYRITYRSLDKPLYKSRVIEIHSKIVARALELGLNVSIR